MYKAVVTVGGRAVKILNKMLNEIGTILMIFGIIFSIGLIVLLSGNDKLFMKISDFSFNFCSILGLLVIIKALFKGIFRGKDI